MRTRLDFVLVLSVFNSKDDRDKKRQTDQLDGPLNNICQVSARDKDHSNAGGLVEEYIRGSLNRQVVIRQGASQQASQPSVEHSNK